MRESRLAHTRPTGTPSKRIVNASDVDAIRLYFDNDRGESMFNVLDAEQCMHILRQDYTRDRHKQSRYERYPIKPDVRSERSYAEWARPSIRFTAGQTDKAFTLPYEALQGMANNLRPFGKFGWDRFQVQGLSYLLNLYYSDDGERVFPDSFLRAWFGLKFNHIHYIKAKSIRGRKTTLFDLTEDVQRMGKMEYTAKANAQGTQWMGLARSLWHKHLHMQMNELMLRSSHLRSSKPKSMSELLSESY